MQQLLQKKDINSEELATLLKEREAGKIDFILVDVREDMEYKMGHIKGVNMLKPTTTFAQWAESFFNENQDKTIIFTCRTGSRSAQVQNVFAQNGHKNAINHYGGIMSYRGEIEK
ncbi:MAG: rhodanese-like domain-containing protein [Sulfurovum sp.]|nr:MAG: rhodanese-like domain-containing protein [Sulfurovum sp.]